MIDEDQIEHADVDASKLVDVPVEELLEEEVVDEIPLLADELDVYEQQDAADLLETPDFMNPYEE